jgi:hypothetical protein
MGEEPMGQILWYIYHCGWGELSHSQRHGLSGMSRDTLGNFGNLL